jgi:hypothetical protein
MEGGRYRKYKFRHRQCQLWVWTRLPNLCTAWMDPLMRVMYRGLTQSVFRLDRVKSIYCDCTANILLDVFSNASFFKLFSSGSSSAEVAEFCPTLRLIYVIVWNKACTCILSSVYSLPCNNFVQK